MKKLKRRFFRKVAKIVYSFFVVLMVFQPVGTAGLYVAIAEDTLAPPPVAEEAPAPTPAPVKESEPAVLVAPVAAPDAAVTPTPIVKEEAPVDAIDPVIAPDPTVLPDDAKGEITPKAAATEKVEATSTKDIWLVDGNKATTNDPVELDKSYVAPQNDQVTVTFSKLPDNPGTLSIEEITLTDEQVTALHALSNKAYDITSDMQDGTFEYALTLPKPKDATANISYIEKTPAEFSKDGTKQKELKQIEKNKVDQKSDSVKSDGIDHFTIYITTYSDETLAVMKTVYQQGEAVYMKAGDLVASHYYRFAIDPPGQNNSNMSYITNDCVTGITEYDTKYILAYDADLDTWQAELHGFTSLDNCTNADKNHAVSAEASFNVTAPTVNANASVTNFPVDCAYNCTANDITVNKMELVDSSGNQLICNPNDQTTAYIKVTYDNHSTDRYATYLIGDVYQAGAFKQLVNGQATCLDHLATGLDSKIISTGFDWTCGESISIKNLTLSWDTNSNTCSNFFSQKKCNPPAQSFCNGGLDYIVVTPLITNFSANNVCLGNQTQFNDSTTGGTPPYHYAWDFGDPDNSASGLQNPTFTYPSAGQFSVTSTVVDSTSPTAKSDDEIKSVDVWAKPSVAFSAGASTCPDMAVQFTNSSTAGSPNGGLITGYTWDFGDGSALSTETNPAHEYSAPGDYTVRLTVNNEHSCNDYKDVKITVGACGGTLNVVKNLVKDNGGTASCQDFSFKVNDGQSVSFTNTCSNSIHVTAGNYDVFENSAAGYFTSYDNCSNVNVPDGGSTTCTITNDDIAPTLKLVKTVTTDNGGTAVAGDWTLTASGTTAGFSDQGDSTTFHEVKAGTEYTLSESSSIGYTPGSWSCDGGTWDGNKITLGLNSNVTCTINNDDQSGTLIVKKVVINDNGGSENANDFTFSVNGGDPITFTESSDNLHAQNNLTVNAGKYTVVENAFSGYSTTHDNCSDVEIPNGGTATCTITNDDQAASLTVIKHVVNDNGGTKTAGNFTMNVIGANVSNASFSGVEAPGTTVTLDAGTYSVDEGMVSGYAKTLEDDCSGTIALGEHKTCTITNDDIAPKLTLIKHVTNNNGGNAVVSDFPLFIDGKVAISGTAYDVDANVSHAATETNQTGYLPSGWSNACATDGTITLLPGENKTCEITNDDVQAKLTVTKIVNDGPYGEKVVSDFPLFVDDTSVTSGVQNGFNVGTYTISETGQAGYAGVIGGDCGADGKITLSAGDVKACTITNTDELGKIIIKKKTLPSGDAQQFTFSGDVTGAIGDGGELSNIVVPGEYSVSESGLAGWDLTGLVCDDGQSITPSTTDLGTKTAEIKVDANETVTCTFTNTKRASITIIKNAINNNAQDFKFTDNFGGSNPSPFYLDDDSNSTLPNSRTFEVLPGTYAVSEESVAGWQQESATCTNGETIDSIDVAPGEAVTCTFVNEQYASIKLVKNTIGGDDSFDFDATGDGLPANIDLTTVNGTVSQTFSDLDQDNTYSLTENVPTGWDLTNAVCTGTNTPTSITPDPGEAVTCTFDNTQRGRIIIVKETVGGDGTFAFDSRKLLTPSFNIATSGGMGSATFNNLLPGNFDVYESVPVDWDLTGLACVDPDSGSSVDLANKNVDIDLDAGETVTCTFTNTKDATLTLVKTVQNDNGGSAVADNFQGKIDDGNIPWGEAQVVSATTHTASETNLTGYTALAWGGDCASNGTVTLSPGENKTCTITNDDQQAYIIIDKTVVNDNGGTAQPNDFNLTIDGNTVLDEVKFPVNPGAYTTNETNLPGYAAGEWGGACDKDGKVTIALGETKTCTITNDDIAPTITLNKIVLGGSAEVDEFGISVDGKSVSSGSITEVGANIPIAINEVGKDGYTFTSISGDENCPEALGGTVTLDEGENITCTITNTRDTGSITVNKIIDADGNLETTDDQTVGIGWQFNVNETGTDTTDGLPTLTNESGMVTFSDLKTGQYNITETTQPGYDLIGASCGAENGSLDGTTLYSASVVKDSSTLCTFYNKPNGTIHGYKWNDLNGSRERDCIASANEELRQTCELEPLLSGWTINLYRLNGDGFENEPFKTILTDGSDEHFGWYWFENLLPGEYKVCEEQQIGWEQTYPLNDNSNCHLVTLPDDNLNNFQESENAVAGPKYNFGNQFVTPQLKIDKFNDSGNGSEDRSPGDIVTYTLTIKAAGGDEGEIPNESNVDDVVVTDLPPARFTYIPGSETLSSTNPSHSGDFELYHVYASPGIWHIGTMIPGEVITLTYKTTISPDQDAGIYNDVAWAQGRSEISETPDVLATQGDPEPFATTAVKVVVPEAHFIALESVEKTKTKTKTTHKTKRVLGASIALPATGASPMAPGIAIILLIIGLNILMEVRKRERMKEKLLKGSVLKILILALLVAGSVFLPGNVKAATDDHIAVKIEKPNSPMFSDFKIGFAALDIDGRNIAVQCFRVGAPDVAITTDYTLRAGGNSGECTVDTSALGDGTYQFYVTADSATGGNVSDKVSVLIDTSAPGTPINYSRSESSCTVSFTTASDSGETASVELYRSTSTDFIADSSTFVISTAIGSGVAGSIIDPSGSCNDYYYTIRAVDAEGNGSDFVGDEKVHVTTKTKYKTSTRTVTTHPTVTTAPAIPIVGAGEVAGAEVSNNGNGNGEQAAPANGEEQGQILGETTREASPQKSFITRAWPWIAGLIILGLIAYGFIRRKKKGTVIDTEK